MCTGILNLQNIFLPAAIKANRASVAQSRMKQDDIKNDTMKYQADNKNHNVFCL